jgi:hypothetical protein
LKVREEVGNMREHLSSTREGTLVMTLLVALSLGALLLSGLVASPAAALGHRPADVSAATQMQSGATRAMDVGAALVARQREHPRVTAQRIRHTGWFDLVFVTLSPRLNHKSYKVVLQVKRDGKWVRQTVTRSFNATHEGKRVEQARLWNEPMQVGNRRLRVVIPAQHGFERTVVKVHWPRYFTRNAIMW